jgi:transposase
MGRIKRTFDAKFKIKVCQAIRSGIGTVADACREFQLSRNTVDHWLEAFDEGRLGDSQKSRERELERENEKLKAKVGELTMQVDALKKMDEWLRQERSVASSIVTAENLARFQRPAPPPASPSRPTTTKGKRTR